MSERANHPLHQHTELQPRQKRVLELVIGAQDRLVAIRRAMTLADVQMLATECEKFADDAVELSNLVGDIHEDVKGYGRTQPPGPTYQGQEW